VLLGWRSSLASHLLFYLGSGCFRSCKEEFEFENIEMWLGSFQSLCIGLLWTVYVDLLLPFCGLLTY
jgi:hypothetical protein